MKVSIYRVYEPFEDQPYKYMTPQDEVHYDGNGILTPIEIDIPDRFKPDYTLGGQPLVHVDADGDGVEEGYMLAEVLGVSHDGKPTIHWYDNEYHCKRSVTLQYETFEKTLRSVW